LKGLQITMQAVEDRSSDILIDSYELGFNSNMCSSIVEMSENKEIPLDFGITWSSVIPPTDPILQDTGVISLSHDSYELLWDAAEKLSIFEPEIVTIEGRVIELSTDDNPLGSDTQRSIILKVYDPVENLSRNIYITLEKDDYMKAIEAHETWETVKITGTLRKKRNRERFINYSSFEIISLI